MSSNKSHSHTPSEAGLTLALVFWLTCLATLAYTVLHAIKWMWEH